MFRVALIQSNWGPYKKKDTVMDTDEGKEKTAISILKRNQPC